MKTKHWIIIAILALLVYLFLRKKAAANSAGSDPGTIPTTPTKPGIFGGDTTTGTSTTVTTDTPGTEILKTDPVVTGDETGTTSGTFGTSGNDVDPMVKPSVIFTTASAAAGDSKFTPRPVRRNPFFA